MAHFNLNRNVLVCGTRVSVIAWNIEKDTLRQAFADCGCRP